MNVLVCVLRLLAHVITTEVEQAVQQMLLDVQARSDPCELLFNKISPH